MRARARRAHRDGDDPSQSVGARENQRDGDDDGDRDRSGAQVEGRELALPLGELIHRARREVGERGRGEV